MSTRVPLKLQMDLRDRWASIVEEDDNTDGFYSDLAKFFGVADPGDLTKEQIEQGRECIRRTAQFLRGNQ